MWKQNDPCETASVGGTFVENGVTFIKLKDNKCWTKSNVLTKVTYANAASSCPSGTYLPSAQDFVDLLNSYGGEKYPRYAEPYGWIVNNGDLYNATGWTDRYWTTTAHSTSNAHWTLSIASTVATIHGSYDVETWNVVCIRSS